MKKWKRAAYLLLALVLALGLSGCSALERVVLPDSLTSLGRDCFYGCDRCQTACPWNKKCVKTDITEFLPNENFYTNNENWEELTTERYKELFSDSAVERAGYTQLMRNIAAIKKKF